MVYTDVIRVKSNEVPEENPMPFFQEQNRTVPVPMRESALEEDKILLGYEAAARFLPYKKRDHYNREKREQEWKTIVLENDWIKAVFLPAYGGRLYSLYHKKLKKELVFKNPVIQTANLGILDAWFSGGIEWNMGQCGHAFTTCDPVFFATLQDEEGNDFLRMFEFERCHELFWQVDFHLPPESEVLQAYVRVINDTKEERSLYWWTNTAVEENEKTRVFSCTEEVLYMDTGDYGYGRGHMPDLAILEGKDASYPLLFPYSNEYFFQNSSEVKMPWEAVVYPEFIFAECSSQPLKYRKMFCWGSHNGGKHWKDYLSELGKGDYIEVQAGLTKTQRHGCKIKPGESVEFIQCFGGMENRMEFYGDSWSKEKQELEKRIHAWMEPEKIGTLLKRAKKYAKIPPAHFLSYGSGFGAMEAARREKKKESKIPKGLFFPPDSMGKEQEAWLKLLNEGYYQEENRRDFPASYCVQKEWIELLAQSVSLHPDAMAYLQIGVYLIENGLYEQAEETLKRSLQYRETALAYRNLGYIHIEKQQMEQAEKDYEQAIAICQERDLAVLYREYFKLLLDQQKNQKLFDCYQKLSESLKDEEHLFMQAVFAGLELENMEFVDQAFKREYANIRENEIDLYEVWKRRYPEKPVPYEIDFRTRE